MKNYRVIVFTCLMAYTEFIKAENSETAKIKAVEKVKNRLPLGVWIYKNREIVEEVA